MNPVELSLFASRIEAVCDEMGVLLRRAAFSPNIRDRLDYSCAVFDARGGLCAQAAHIPVHLGSMAYAMRDIVGARAWREGDQLILNDPFLGGTHLPDVTLIAPVFVDDVLVGFVANRAHHADIGASAPGSMPLSRHLDEEGLLIPPTLIQHAGELDRGLLQRLTSATRNAADAEGDFTAQLGCNQRGAARLAALVANMGVPEYGHALAALNDYAAAVALSALKAIPLGRYEFADVLESDGQGGVDLPIRVVLEWDGRQLRIDFTGSAGQSQGNINCPVSVTAAGALYAVRCLYPAQTPACEGAFRPIQLVAVEGSLLNARRPAAVAAGNVETSTRVVDVVLGALAKALPDRIAAASQGTMNNLAFGAEGERPWGYYETMGGGMGGGPSGPGLSAVQTHMTNTRNTPVEVLEMRFPMRVERYQIRRGSGGAGLHGGGDGLVREFKFLEPASCTFLTERRLRGAWGLAGGGEGRPGRNAVNGQALAGKCEVRLASGDIVTVETPGGGGWGLAPVETVD